MLTRLARRIGGAGVAPAVILLSSVRLLAAEIRWEGDGECDDPVAVVAQVEDLVGTPLEAIDDEGFDVLVRRESEDRWIATLHSTDWATGEERTRELAGASCDEIMDAVAVAIAMAIEAQREEATSEEPPSPSQEEPAPRKGRIDQEPREKRGSEESPRTIRSSAAAAFVLDAGALPRLAPGAELGASLGYSIVELTVLGNYFAPQEHLVAGGGGGEFSLILGALLACAGRPEWDVMGCAGLEIGSLRAEGIDVDRSRVESALWLALRADVRMTLPLSRRLSFLARAGAVAPLRRPEFVLDGADPVHRPAGLGGRASVGLGFHFSK